ncbi:catalase X [Lysobacter bugurensis]|uniref:Catalase n=1 Tax=Cognatilysobacter bugurensis TaxID=543356 RepID=A0A918SVY2_9GAMM|nr:catalase X [Lysobacter bugurensis]
MIHARNAGAYGFFEAYGRLGDEPIEAYTRADLFLHAGARTPVFTRFSTVAHGGHGPETVRDPRGFSIRFHTHDGRWDFVGSSLPVSFVRDPTLFPSVAHAFRPEPLTHRLDPRRVFEFIRFAPSALNMLTWLFSPWGIPANYRSMHGFGTGAWVNANGRRSHVRYHLVPKNGDGNLTQAEADALQAVNFNHATQDLHEAIARGDAPEWELAVQVLTDVDCAEDDFDPLDPTAVWPKSRAPLRPIGRVVLDRNPRSYFAEVEQVMFKPSALVDGLVSVEHETGQTPLPAARAVERTHADELRQLMAGRRAANAPRLSAGSRQCAGYDSNHRHAGDTYRSLSSAEREELVRNLVAALGDCDQPIRSHMIEHFHACDADYGLRVAAGLAQQR